MFCYNSPFCHLLCPFKRHEIIKTGMPRYDRLKSNGNPPTTDMKYLFLYASGSFMLQAPFWAVAPKGPMTYAFIYAEISPSPPPPPTSVVVRTRPQSLKAQILASRPKSQPLGPNPSLQAQIPAFRPKSQPSGPNPSLAAQNPALRPKT